MTVMAEAGKQAASGLVPPEVAEANIRETWPSVAAFPAIASLGRVLTGTIVLAPLAWLIMALAYFGKLSPFLARRYAITNRRVIIRRGLKGTPGQEVALADIDDVRVQTDANSDFFRAANIEIIAKGQVALTLHGVCDPESFRHAILNARNAWAPGKAKGAFIPASATPAK
jgi:Bacterial PH domain